MERSVKFRVTVRDANCDEVTDRIERAIALADEARAILESLTVDASFSVDVEPTDETGRT